MFRFGWGEVAGFANGRAFRNVGEESLIDAQLGYEFQSGPLEGLSFLVQGNNLTDETVVANTVQPPFGRFVVGTLRPPRLFGQPLGLVAPVARAIQRMAGEGVEAGEGHAPL